MKILPAIAAIALFLASFPMFAYSFAVPEAFAPFLFFAGILAVTFSLMIPITILGRRD
ncbi:hypothetical protein EV140_1996 [Microcella alkaliphila]|uniref:Uncharacterized protein n=1 Tax=Microcella alkaliphila TaxID=279828 RepID=A0A4Q7TI96_9MICO|nr:hypothetical protein [Microcella alkaliphila]RZT59390.1 hypothetical protein EV140_1996 [Microcella alkaliphila]